MPGPRPRSCLTLRRPPGQGCATPARVLAGCLALFLSGCDASSEGSLEGIEALPEVGVEREVAIGHPDDPDYAFTSVTGIVVAPDGTIWSKHRQEGVLRRWGEDGAPLGVVGRRGEGPGEFSSPSAMGIVGPLPGDSIWVHDSRLARFTFLGWDGSVLSSRPAPFDLGTPEETEAGSLPPRPAGMFRDGSVHAAPPLPSDAVARGLVDRTAHVAQVEGTGAVDTVAIVPVAATMTLALLSNGGGVFTSQPYADAAIAARSPDGSTFLVVERTAAPAEGAATFRVTRVAAVPPDGGVRRGDTLASVEVPYRAVGIPAADVEHRVELVHEALFEFAGPQMGLSESAFRRRVSEAVYRPATLPPVTAALPGRDGSTWLQVAELPEGGVALSREEEARLPRRWVILDAAGEPVRAVRLPPGVRPLLVEVDRFWGVETDALGVEYVVRYRVVAD